ncbi:MAG: hypothetical protein Q9220_001408 [cf. Caloplaca sp. 1 TL-2023]
MAEPTASTPPETTTAPETVPLPDTATSPPTASSPVVGSSLEATALPKATAPTPVNAVYYPNWKVYGNAPPSSLDLDHITHVLYAFAFDEHADLQANVDGTSGGLSAVKNLKHKHPRLKTLLSIGGGGKGSDPFAGVASNPSTREKFASSARAFLDAHGFDGLDNLGKAASYMDYINLMAYDFAGPWTKLSGYQAQLHTPPNNSPDMRTSGQSAVQYIVSKKVPPGKIVLGIPAYGQSFLGATLINEKFKGPGGDGGTFEYTQLPRPGTQEKVDKQAVAAYCVGGDGGLVTYDNAETVRVKGQYVKEHKLGGMFYWTGAGDVKGPRSLVAAGYNAMHSNSS